MCFRDYPVFLIFNFYIVSMHIQRLSLFQEMRGILSIEVSVERHFTRRESKPCIKDLFNPKSMLFHQRSQARGCKTIFCGPHLDRKSSTCDTTRRREPPKGNSTTSCPSSLFYGLLSCASHMHSTIASEARCAVNCQIAFYTSCSKA